MFAGGAKAPAKHRVIGCFTHTLTPIFSAGLRDSSHPAFSFAHRGINQKHVVGRAAFILTSATTASFNLPLGAGPSLIDFSIPCNVRRDTGNRAAVSDKVRRVTPSLAQLAAAFRCRGFEGRARSLRLLRSHVRAAWLLLVLFFFAEWRLPGGGMRCPAGSKWVPMGIAVTLRSMAFGLTLVPLGTVALPRAASMLLGRTHAVRPSN
jgi:hypothetical protein